MLSEGPVYGANGEKRTGTYATTIYTAPKGNLVFNAGTCWWNVVLSSPPGFQNPPRKDFRRNDVRIQRITKNILDRMIADEGVIRGDQERALRQEGQEIRRILV